MQQNHTTRWLTIHEASLILQRFMPHKSAIVWLDHDRRVDPVIPFSHHGDEVVYRSDDLEHFVRHYLVSQAEVDCSERRVRVDRRLRIERRHNPSVRLTASAERRHAHANDRRGGFTPERRSGRMAA